MIDPSWQVVDLDPRTWRAIGHLLNPANYVRATRDGERALFVLHDGGAPLNVYDSARGRRADLAVDRVDAPADLAADLHRRGEWDSVHVIDRQHLAHVSTTAQASARRELSLDAYYRLVSSLIWDGSHGYVVVPPKPGDWNGWTYEGIHSFVRGLPSPSSVALGVIAGGEVAIGLVLKVGDGMIRMVTTFEALAVEPAPSVTAAYADRVADALGRTIAPPATVLICTQDVFDRWITDSDKRATLAAAVDAGEAVLVQDRTRESDPRS